MGVGLRLTSPTGDERFLKSRKEWDEIWDELQSSGSSSYHLAADHRDSTVTSSSPSAALPSSEETLPLTRMHPSTSHSRKTTDTSLPSSTPLSRVSAFRGRPGRVLGGLTILFLLALSSLSPKPKSTINSQLDIETFTFTNTTHPIPPTCETCIADPEDALCRRYGIENVRLSRMYEGSGYRIGKVIERALRGELISIGIIGASVTAGHGIEGHPKWFEVFLQDWMLSFPNTTVYDGSAPGMNSQFYSYCFESYVPPSADLYMIELDVNNDNAEYTFRHDDALYRGLLQLPHHPAVLRVSVPAMSFWELARGSPSGLLMSNYFDIPMIGIRNIIVPHLLLHPNDTPTFFHLDADGVETRHIPYISHQAQGDLLALYMREQVCKTKQRLGMRITPRESMWPSEDILREIPDQHLWESWEPGSHISPIHPSCSLVGNKWNPLTPLPPTSWSVVEWNGKAAIASHTVGAHIDIPFSGKKVGAFVWSTGGENNEVKPGRAICFVDGLREGGIVLDAWHDWGYGTSRWRLIADGLEHGYHVLRCEILEESSTDNHDFRILGIGAM